jgi:hypothetical protein
MGAPPLKCAFDSVVVSPPSRHVHLAAVLQVKVREVLS